MFDLNDIPDFVKTGAATLAGALAGPAAPIVTPLVASVLGVGKDDTEALKQAIQDPENLVKLQELEARQKHEIELAILKSETARLDIVNKTMQVEATSADTYVSHWRPRLGRRLTDAWFIQALVVVLVMAFVPFAVVFGDLSAVDAEKLINGTAEMISSTSGIWMMALGVLGVNSHARSRDKKVAAMAAVGQKQTGLLEQIGGIFAGKGR